MGAIYSDAKYSHIGGVKALQCFEPSDRLFLVEQGFLASSHSWSEAMKSKDPTHACLGYVYDDIGYYFMADYPNRLIHRLNSNLELSKAEAKRAQNLIKRIVEEGISKYNSQSLYVPAMTEGYTTRVLVCDQSYGDASTTFGKIDDAGFEQMLLSAIRENSEAEIIVKTHPDTFWEKGTRVGYYNHLQDTGRLRILRQPVNPFSLFKHVDKVYVGTSQLGLEALFAGKEVVCFGAPFYAGWGLTDDRQVIPHRHRKRTLEELFHYFYIWYTIYHVPGDSQVPSEVESVLDYISENRPTQPVAEVEVYNSAPIVSVILPVYNVEKYIRQALKSLLSQTLQNIEVITVHDKGTDRSQAIIDEMAERDHRLLPIVLAENIGQGFARNKALEKAKGEFVFFLDSDDYTSCDDFLERAVERARADNAQMLRVSKAFERVEDAEGKLLERRKDPCEAYFKRDIHAVTIDQEPDILQSRHFWSWLYRRDFLIENDIKFLTTQWEERPFVLKAFLSAERISVLPYKSLIYRVRQNSTARRAKTIRDSFNQLANLIQMVDMLETYGAFDRENRFHYTGSFMIMQALHILFYGFAFKTVLQDGSFEQRDTFLSMIRDALKKTGYVFDDLVMDARQVQKSKLGDGTYRLIFDALLCEEYEYVEKAVMGEPFLQEELFETLLAEPANETQETLQQAISSYARNEHVVTAIDWEPIAQKPRLIIHLGQTKTGSTFVQHFLENNRAALLRKGVWYPEVGLFWQEDRPHKQAGQSEFTKEAVNKETALFDYIEAGLSLAGGKIHTIILSSEAYFLNRRSLLIADHFAGYPVEMVGYFRRQDDWANSQYAEFVAGGAVGRVADDFFHWSQTDLLRERLDHYATCQLWASRIGHENVHARFYDRKTLKNGDIVADFLTAVGLEEHEGLPRPSKQQANDFPFGNIHVELILEANRHNWKSPRNYINFVEKVTQQVRRIREEENLPKPSVDLVSNDARRHIMRSLKERNDLFVEEFCPEAAGMLEPNDTQVAHTPSIVSQREISAIMDALAQEALTRKPHVPSPLKRPNKLALNRNFSKDDIRGLTIGFTKKSMNLSASQSEVFQVALFNVSAFRIPTDLGGLPINISFHLFDKDGGRVEWSGPRTPLTAPVEHQLFVPVEVTAPSKPGTYLLQAAIVFEGIMWVDGSQMQVLNVE